MLFYDCAVQPAVFVSLVFYLYFRDPITRRRMGRFDGDVLVKLETEMLNSYGWRKLPEEMRRENLDKQLMFLREICAEDNNKYVSFSLIRPQIMISRPSKIVPQFFSFSLELVTGKLSLSFRAQVLISVLISMYFLTECEF